MRKRDKRVNHSVFSIWNYCVFFLLVAFITTCCLVLFIRTWGIEVDISIRKSAILTFVNVLFLSLFCTVIDSIRRIITVERPVKRILSAAHQLTQGDFSTRIEPLHGLNRMNEFDIIIDDFNKMAEELSGIETLRTDFIANVSHELKTPLAVIQNYAAMLQNPELTNEARIEYSKTIANSSRKFSELISNILKLNKLENQQIFPEVSEYNVGEQLRECLLLFEDVWEKKNLSIETDIEDITISADSELLALVWNNLFSNAIKFTDNGGKISVSLKPENNYVIAKIADNGCGMPSEIGERIFEKFYQGDNSHSAQGNGLGLALVKRVVDIIDGEIIVESEVGKGSTFTVKLRGDVQ